MKVFLLGGYGLLGTEIYFNFKKEGFQVFRFPKDKVNLLNLESLKIINEIKPDLIIHAAGYTNVEESEKCISKAIEVNCKGIYNLLFSLEDKTTPIIFFSTDYVFNGQNDKPYKEEDIPLPINNYGLSKLMAEDILRANYKNHYIIRTSWLFGEYGNCFPKTIIERCNSGSQLKVVSDQRGTPTYTKDLVESIRQIVYKKLPFGTYNITNSGETTWFDFALLILKYTNISKPNVIKIFSENLPSNTKRPKYSVLSNEKINSYGIFNRNFDSAIQEYLNTIME